jgi:HNH endonuclease
MPSRGSVAGRASSITAAFFQAVTPVVVPTDEEVDEALEILSMDRLQCSCAYCGGTKTEWDHFRPIVEKRRPTGYITEIANLVPACGKCNQSKGNKHWRAWIIGPAPGSPATQRVPELDARIDRLQHFEAWRMPVRLNYSAMVGQLQWDGYMSHLQAVLSAIAAAQSHADVLRREVERQLQAVDSHHLSGT